MGYFSNGTEGMMYEDQYCRNCYHSGCEEEEGSGCAVWDAHFIYNYDSKKEVNDLLSIFIPRSDDKLTNKKCTMFVDRSLIQNDVATPLLPFTKE